LLHHRTLGVPCCITALSEYLAASPLFLLDALLFVISIRFSLCFDRRCHPHLLPPEQLRRHRRIRIALLVTRRLPCD
jgi:hypothetical protein